MTSTGDLCDGGDPAGNFGTQVHTREHAHAPARPHVLLTGVSTRAAAESAAKAGFAVTALDAFGDLDQHAAVRALALPRDFGVRFTSTAAARCARELECDAVAYLSSFENHPAAVRLLGAGRALWGNPPAVLKRVRDPMLLSEALRRRGIATPEAIGGRGQAAPPDASDPRRWLVKRRASGGGYGIEEWQLGRFMPRGCYLQERIDGTPGSVVFIAAGGRAVVLGVSRQIVGDEAFGAAGYTYCGNILAAGHDPQFEAGDALLRAARVLAEFVASEFRLVGANGIDFVARDGTPYAVEVNPRWSASMELVERAHGDTAVGGSTVFGAHARACATGELPRFDADTLRRDPFAVGKAIVFARRGLRVPDSRAWLDDPTVRDVPRPGEYIAAGRPVCTVYAHADTASACYSALVHRAHRVYEELGTPERAVA